VPGKSKGFSGHILGPEGFSLDFSFRKIRDFPPGKISQQNISRRNILERGPLAYFSGPVFPSGEIPTG